MKIDRRSFLSFVIGGAAGTAFTPLPWKLTDDSAIWTQMWPWTPVPDYGEVSYVNSTCTLCPGGCGITVRKIEERVVKIEGLSGHPVNDGGLCLLGLSGAQLLYGPRRVKTPLKKVNGKFRRISWDEAIGELATKLADLRAKGGSHKVAFIAASDQGTLPELINRFLTVYGSPNFIRTPSILDSYELTLDLMHGVQALPGFDIENTDFVLSFGSGLLDGWGSPVHMFRANSSWRDRKSTVVQIEPRLSNTAAKSDKWIPIKPGTEGALALGLAHVIIKESLYKKDFVHNYTIGFEKWRRPVVDGFSPDIVAKITDVDQTTITDLARKFARASKPLAVCGRGRGTTPGSLKEFMAVHALNALVGNLNMAGGLWTIPDADYIDWPELEMDDTASTGMQKGRIDGAGSQNYPHARYLFNRLSEVINSASSPPIDVLGVVGSNPVYTAPDTLSTKEAFEKIPLVVSFSSYMDETAEMADLILPNHIYLERYEDVPVISGIKYPLIGLAKPVIDPQFNTKHTGDVIILLAQALGGFIANAFPWESYEACLEETLGDKWETLLQQGFWLNVSFSPPSWAKAFETASGKFEFVNDQIDALPRFSSLKPEGKEASFPLVLIPYDSMRLQREFIGNPPFVIKTVEDTVLKANDVLVEISPDTARPLGLKEGGYAELSTPKGSARVKVHIYDGIKPGLVAIPAGLGHTAYSKYLAGKGVNINSLIGPVEDPASGHDAAWGIRAKLSKA
ncbi:MAG: molybdopterin-dependent oxidoreductase [Deltaproteobacteria bacterium]|nr:MAG: molybdopterin-dependent oxidoreductase [Deltaproteobacteria bacterium]